MSSLVIILTLTLQFEAGISGGFSDLGYRPGHEAILPCDHAPPFDSTCSTINWVYSRNSSQIVEVVWNGTTIKNSTQYARLRLYSNCSLGIKNATAEDAGTYYCQHRGPSGRLTTVTLNRFINLYHTPGNDVVLPCDNVSDTCSVINWFYNRRRTGTVEVVRDGIIESSARAARLSLYSNCSLGIRNVTADDAGAYCCRLGMSSYQYRNVYLHILTISASPSGADPQRDGDVTLKCSLLRYSDLPACRNNTVRWVDETGTVLPDRGVRNIGWTSCSSFLTVNNQSGHNNRYTCQFIENNIVKIEAHYARDVTDGSLRYIMWALRIALLILMIIITVFVIREREIKKPHEGIEVQNVGDDDDDLTVTYENVKNRLANPELD